MTQKGEFLGISSNSFESAKFWEFLLQGKKLQSKFKTCKKYLYNSLETISGAGSTQKLGFKEHQCYLCDSFN